MRTTSRYRQIVIPHFGLTVILRRNEEQRLLADMQDVACMHYCCRNVVRYHHNRYFLLFIQLFNYFIEFLGYNRVQSRYGLVQQKKLAGRAECARQ